MQAQNVVVAMRIITRRECLRMPNVCACPMYADLKTPQTPEFQCIKLKYTLQLFKYYCERKCSQHKWREYKHNLQVDSELYRCHKNYTKPKPSVCVMAIISLSRSTVLLPYSGRSKTLKHVCATGRRSP